MQYSRQNRTERLIAGGRVVLAVVSLAAVWLDPSEPTRYATQTYLLLGAYVAHSIVLAVYVRRRFLPLGKLPVATHGLDLGAFTLLMYLTEGPTSPFFAYFTFAVVGSAMRWGRRGVLITAGVALAALGILGLYASLIPREPSFEFDRFLIRAAYLAVVAALVASLADNELRARTELGRLADWPPGIPGGMRDAAEDLLRLTSRMMESSRALLLWQDDEEPWQHVAILEEDTVEHVRAGPGTFEPAVDTELAGLDLLLESSDRGSFRVIVRHSSGRLERRHGVAVHPRIMEHLRHGAVLSFALAGEGFTGRLFFQARPGVTNDDLLFGSVLAREAAGHLTEWRLRERLRAAVTSAERARLAQDLHDGFLQSLTALGVRLQTIRHHLSKNDPEAAFSNLEIAQSLVVEEQRGLRQLIDAARRGPSREEQPTPKLADRLHELCERIRSHWNLTVEVDVRDQVPVPADLAQDVCRLAHEALVNAARHAEATCVRVDLATGNGAVRLTVTDDGRGFPFHGIIDGEETLRTLRGPVSLARRVSSRGGTLSVDSTPDGSTITMLLPLHAVESRA